MMSDRTISMTTTGAIALWVIGLGLLLFGAFFEWRLMPFGLWVSGLGAILTTRRMICQMCSREQAAFELGRDSIRSVH